MVVGSRIDGGTPNISARVRKTIQSIKEIVGNHSEADIYVTLKESNMDPNETAQKLLYQDPFHEVRRRRDKKKENISYKASAEPRRQTEHTQVAKSQAFPGRNVRRGGFVRNAQPGFSREFRVVRDNRVNQNTSRDIKPGSLQSSSSANVEAIPNVPAKSSIGILTDQDHLAARKSEDHKSSQAINRPSHSTPGQVQDACSSGTHRKGLFEDTWSKTPSSVSVAQCVKPSNSRPPSATLASSNSEVGVYSSSSDPVHVPSPDSRSSGAVGAIKREVGVVGVRRQLSENSANLSSVPSSSLSTSLSGKDVSSPPESYQQSSSVTKTGHLGQATVSESTVPISTTRSFLGNQHTSKAHQLMGHQKAMQPNMEWKPKSSQKSSSISLGVTGTVAALISPPSNNPTDSKLEADHLEGKFSQLNITGSQHVIIPEHLRVPEADRTKLTFGSFDVDFDPNESIASRIQGHGSEEQSNGESSASVSAPLGSKEDANEVQLLSGQTRSSGSVSPGSDAASGHPSPDKKDSSSPRDLENYADIGLVRNDSPSYTPAEPQQQQQLQDLSGLRSFVAYDPQTAYDMPFFNPAMEESARGQSLPSLQEAAASSNPSNSIPASTVAMIQQQSVPQLYPQMHVSHFPNFVPYRQFLSPVYVPPMAVPGYSSNPAYPHPSNGNSYLLMPGGSSHLAAGSLKYGPSQYKPVPAGTPTGFGSYSNSPGYAMNAQGTVGGASGLEDSTRIKYKDGNLFIPNAQADASELWIQTPRELPGLPSTPFYNMAGQAPHPAYLPNHTGHASFNAAAAAAAAAGQPGPMQYPALYHPSPQAAAIANPHHHMVPGMGGNVGAAAAAAPGAQVGAYQQPQLGGHLNWNTNF